MKQVIAYNGRPIKVEIFPVGKITPRKERETRLFLSESDLYQEIQELGLEDRIEVIKNSRIREKYGLNVYQLSQYLSNEDLIKYVKRKYLNKNQLWRNDIFVANLCRERNLLSSIFNKNYKQE